MNPVIMHINYGEVRNGRFGKNTVDSVCRMAADIGYDGIEFRGKIPVELQELSFREYAELIAEGKKKYGLSDILFGIGVRDCTSADKEIREKSISDAIEQAKIASELCGTTVCNTYSSEIKSSIPTAPASSYEFHGSAAATEEDWKLIADAYSRIGKELEKIGVKFAFETHMNYIHDLPHMAKKLVDLIDSPMVGINMDYGNTFAFPVRPTVEEAIDLYGDKLFYVHLKNSSYIPGTTSRIATSLSDGQINHRAYLEKLQDVGFTGPIGIEAPRAGDRVWYAQQDFNYYKALTECM